jgi:hypothetical protein
MEKLPAALVEINQPHLLLDGQGASSTGGSTAAKEQGDQRGARQSVKS